MASKRWQPRRDGVNPPPTKPKPPLIPKGQGGSSDKLEEGDDVQVYESGRGWYCYATFRFYGGDKKCVVRISGDTRSIIKPVEHVRRSR